MKDHLGREAALPGPPRRVVSLVPSITESVLALGGSLVGRTAYCPDAPGARVCGGTKTPDLDAILALAPDLVLANKEENREQDIASLASRLPVFVTDIRSVSTAVLFVEELRRLLFSPDSPLTLSPSLSPSPALPPQAAAATLIWKQGPTLTAVGEDTYAADLLRHCGLANVLRDPAGRYPRLSLDELASLKPNLVVLPSEPYPWTPAEAKELEDELARRGAPARTVFVSGEALTWWGVRTERALLELKKAFA